MDRTINIILLVCSVLVAFTGLFFVLKIWLVWGLVDRGILKARVFLDDKFLVRNWIYIFIIGAFIVLRRIIELLGLLDYQLQGSWITVLFDIIGLIVVTLLVLLAYDWYKLVYSAVGHSKKKHKNNLRFLP